ncbi:hypothetical protein MAPG_06541 [Magnaporthiopsis poae ATCC 64411]|uniref:HMG box domain-containing protein n=1 Tax=Magnaporthiopsis poae (strain ATCC 64411 / 73-15) TaxID=644358 RepID=A0A0C4E2B0_MAGP6|nr:hypothetical protein MAPG_06541 [Magnaporthiopsis poae ATCC 64411]
MTSLPHHTLSLPPSRYSTPPIQSGPSGESGSPGHADFGLSLPQPGYGNQPQYGSDLNPSPYGPLPDEIQEMQSRDAARTQPYGTPATSPPTPPRRSVRAAAKRKLPVGFDDSENNSPEPESPRRRKTTKNKAAPKDLVINKPLSELAVEMGVEVEDMHKYVTRSVQERHEEIDRMGVKDRGRIKRPMNSFMLYRKAYQAMTKKYCGQDNHQVVSRVCGDSWRHLESDEFKAEYERYAKLDRSGHKAAWPDYKFKPAKPRGKKAKDDDDDDDDPNWTFRRVHRDEDPAIQGDGFGPMSRAHTPSMVVGMSDHLSRHASPSGQQYRRYGSSPASHASPYQSHQRYMSGSPYPQPPLTLHGGVSDFDFGGGADPGPPMSFRGYHPAAARGGEPGSHMPSRLDMAHMQQQGQSSHMASLAYDGLSGGAGAGDHMLHHHHHHHHHGLPDRHSPVPVHDDGLIYSPSDLLPGGGGDGSFHAVAPPHQPQQYGQQHYQQPPRHLQQLQEQFYGQSYLRNQFAVGQKQQPEQLQLQSSRQASEPPLVDPSLLDPLDAAADHHHLVAPELGALGGLNETLMAGGHHGFDEWEITDWPAEGEH